MRGEKKLIDYYHGEIRNNFPTHTLYTKTGNKQLSRLFLSFPFVLFLCSLPASAFAGKTGITDTAVDYKNILVPILLLLVVSLSIIIAGLAVCLHRLKNKLRRSHEYLVRYITSNLELKKQIPGLEEPYPFNPPEITPEEFTKVIDNMLKRIMFLSLFVLLALPLASQNREADSTYTFRFLQGKEAFFVPYRNNAPTLDRLIFSLESSRLRLEGDYSYVSIPVPVYLQSTGYKHKDW